MKRKRTTVSTKNIKALILTGQNIMRTLNSKQTWGELIDEQLKYKSQRKEPT